MKVKMLEVFHFEKCFKKEKTIYQFESLAHSTSFALDIRCGFRGRRWGARSLLA